MTRKGGLGKGLDALIPGDIPSNEGVALLVPVDQIVPNPRQPRGPIAEDGLSDLAESIREHGILQPLIVTHDPADNRYILIAGERRLRAARLAGLEAVPVLVRQASGQQRLELALIENIQREDLSPLEKAEAYNQLTEEFGLTHEEISRRVGKSRESVTNTMRLLRLAPEVRAALTSEKISEGHARALLRLPAARAQAAALETILRLEFSVRQTEELVKKLLGEKPPGPRRSSPAAEVSALEERLRQTLGTRVNLRRGKKGGSIVIHYYSDEELNALIDQITKE